MTFSGEYVVSAGAQWVGQVKDLVREAVEQLPDHGGQTQALAQVEPDPAAPGWFTVLGRLTSAQVETLDDGQLRHGSDPRTYGVLEVVVAGENVRLRAAVGTPRARLELQVPAADQRRILSALTDGLEAVRNGPLLDGFAARKLTPIAGELSVHNPDALRPKQKRAVQAACSPGLQLVWSPPGTGSGRVIATAIEQLAASGRRVLLVSATAVSIDDALRQAVALIQPAPGEVLRVGAIHRPELADDDRVNLIRLTEAQQSEAHQRAAALEARLRGLRVAEDELKTTRASIAEFDAAEYERASRRVAARAAYERQQQDLRPAEVRLGLAVDEQVRVNYLMLSLACREAAERAARARNRLSAVDAELSALRGRGWNRMKNSRAIAKVQAGRLDLVDELARARSTLGQAEEEARQAGIAVSACGSQTREAIESERDSAAGRLKAAKVRLTDVRRELARLGTLDLATPADDALVTEQWRLWQLHNSLPMLQERAGQERRQRGPIEREHEQLLIETERERKALAVSLVSEARVVATTLTQLALRPWITETPFDHVIVADACALQFPHLVQAVGVARVGATLIGDYLQNGPSLDPSFPGSEKVRAFFTTDCFSHFEITDPAQAKPGSVVLTDRFGAGPSLTELANRVAYQGLLSPAGAETSSIVVVTVDGLPPVLRTIYHGAAKQAGWWSIGALLGRALAEQHASFGVISPYPQQVQATLSLLDPSSSIPIGTADAFQGRSFDTVLADLVEDGGGWMAGARRHGGPAALEGLRRFTVAVTSARRRLYVLVSAAALTAAQAGPLSVLNALITAGDAERVELAALLSRPSGGPAASTAERDLLASLDPYFLVDDDLSRFVAQIEDAESSIWCWNSWTGLESMAVMEALVAAQARGVEVRLMVPPVDQVDGNDRRSLTTLSERLPHAVSLRNLHQKIVITDRRWSVVGSVPGVTRPGFVIAVDSEDWAERLLIQERADELTQRRTCRECGSEMREAQELERERGRRWAWVCGNGHQTPFPEVQKRYGWVR